MTQEASLRDVGLGAVAQTIIYLISLLPFVGLVIGANYALRRHTATRLFGRRLLRLAVLLHLIYGLCLCPASLYLTIS